MKRIYKLNTDGLRDRCLFTLGIDTANRATDEHEDNASAAATF